MAKPSEVPENEIDFIVTPEPAPQTVQIDEDCGVRIVSASPVRLGPQILGIRLTVATVSFDKRWNSSSRRTWSRRIFQRSSSYPHRRCSKSIQTRFRERMGSNYSRISPHIVPSPRWFLVFVINSHAPKEPKSQTPWPSNRTLPQISQERR